MFRLRTATVALVTCGVLASTPLLPGPATAQDRAPGEQMLAAASRAPGLSVRVEPNPRLSSRARVASGSDDPVVLSGSLVDADGDPVAHRRVRVDLEPSANRSSRVASGVGVALVRLDETSTDAHGQFTLRARRLGDLSGYVADDGSVSLLVTSLGAGERTLYHVRAVPPTAGSQRWRWAARDDRATVPASATASSTRTSTGLSGLRLRSYPAEPAPTPLPRSLSVATDPPNRYCTGVTYYWVRSDHAKIKTYDRIQRMFTLGRTRWTYKWSTVRNTLVDAAANLGKHGALVAAGYTRVQRRSSGVTFKAGHHRNFDAAVQFDNRPYYLYCHDVASGKTWYSGMYEWRPFKFTGGNAKLKPRQPVFRCRARYRAKIQNPLWVARQSSYTHQVGATISTARLRVRQTNSEHHRLTFTPTRRRAWLCGSNDYVTFARQVREVRRP